MQITILLGSGSAGRSEESNSGSELEQKEPTDPGSLTWDLSLKFFSFLSHQVGDKLRQLETSWVGLVSKNYEIEQVSSFNFLGSHWSCPCSQAIMNMEQEHSYLKTQQTTRMAE